MGFKTDTSFLRFLTMGALGVRQTMSLLESQGFEPIELERYCSSNKIWSTKVKRLRLPDVMCIRTGLRAEVRAKSDLKIRMSDAPNNPDRAWDAGLRDEDLAAFIQVSNDDNTPSPADEVMFFQISELRETQHLSKLGAPKSPSEGAERDRTWPATVPTRSGRVTSVTSDKIVVEQFKTAEKPTRKQTYSLKNKKAYVKPGAVFEAGTCFLSGAPSSMGKLSDYRDKEYDPIEGLRSPNQVDRYAAAKALPYRRDLENGARSALEALLKEEMEGRTRLEAAGSATALGSSLGETVVTQYIWGNESSSELCMEAVLILTEIGQGDFARDTLIRVASDPLFEGNEVRQAAVWGLGKAGLKSYFDILPHIADQDENVALHAIAAFGEDTPRQIVEQLVEAVTSMDPRRAPAASEVLRIIGSSEAIETLAESYDENTESADWIVATLGRMPPDLIAKQLQGTALMRAVAPLLLSAPGAHWLSSEENSTSIDFLVRQNL